MRVTKTFTALVCGACIGGFVLVAAGAVGESEFLRTLGGFPLLLALFLLPHALLEWDTSRASL